MKSKTRPHRVGEQIRKEIAGMLTKGLKDPRIGFVSIMEVRMAPDLSVASVYVSLFGDEKQRKRSLIGLRQASGWIRREIGQRIRLRLTPEIRFLEDTTLDHAYRIEEVIKEIHREEGKDHHASR